MLSASEDCWQATQRNALKTLESWKAQSEVLNERRIRLLIYGALSKFTLARRKGHHVWGAMHGRWDLKPEGGRCSDYNGKWPHPKDTGYDLPHHPKQQILPDTLHQTQFWWSTSFSFVQIQSEYAHPSQTVILEWSLENREMLSLWLWI